MTIADVAPEEAYHVFEVFDRLPKLPRDMVEWQQGRTGRSHHRFVAELPDGLSPMERHQILVAFCDMLSRDGWMVVAVIHQPDAHGDRRNYHIHVDSYRRRCA